MQNSRAMPWSSSAPETISKNGDDGDDGDDDDDCAASRKGLWGGSTATEDYGI